MAAGPEERGEGEGVGELHGLGIDGGCDLDPTVNGDS